MNLHRDLHTLPDACKGAVIALGNFDGVHVGHHAILAECAALAKGLGAPAAVMTFEPHPRRFFSPDSAPLRLSSFREKIEALGAHGITHGFVLRFNAALAATSAESFIDDILHKTLKVRHVVTGYNFAFGKRRGGDSHFLTQRAHRHGFGFTAHEQVKTATGQAISSSAIRALLAEGDVQAAAIMLGRPYAISGHVSHGEKRGRSIGFPTLNISLRHRFLPRFGVYAVRVRLKDEARIYDGVANIGVKPTFGQNAPLLEAHCFGLGHEVYGRLAEVELVAYIRDERVFASLEMLKVQIGEDAARARELLHA